MEHTPTTIPNQRQNSPQTDKQTIHDLVENSKANHLNAADAHSDKGTHHNETKKIQEKNAKEVEPNNPKAEHPAADQIDEKDLPPFQAGKPVI